MHVQFFTVLFILLIIQDIETKNSRMSSGNGTYHKICNRSYFEETYVKDNKYLELTTLKEFKKCPKMQCVGSDLLAAVYAEDAHHNFLFFVQPGDDVTASKNAGCWGFVLEVFTRNSSYTLYKNFDKKDNRIFWKIYTTPGSRYSFMLTAIPVGRQTERIFIKTPTKCGNEVLVHILKKTQEEGWFKKCYVLPNFRKRRDLAERICHIAPTNSTARREIVRSNLFVQNCSYHLNGTFSTTDNSYHFSHVDAHSSSMKLQPIGRLTLLVIITVGWI